MPSSGHYPQSNDAPIVHDWCFATHLCKRCGASAAAIASGERSPYCEPGVTGISWQRQVERFRDRMAPGVADLAGPGVVYVPLYRMTDFAKGEPVPFKPEDPSAA